MRILNSNMNLCMRLQEAREEVCNRSSRCFLLNFLESSGTCCVTLNIEKMRTAPSHDKTISSYH